MKLLQYTVFTNNSDPSCRYEFRIQEYYSNRWITYGGLYNESEHSILKD